MHRPPAIGVRWTLGNVSTAGFEALQLSIWGAWKIFGASAEYAVCVNSIELERARRLTGKLPTAVLWHDATRDVPAFLRRYLDDDMAQGVAWKFAPLRMFPDSFELCLDNDCILWSAPAALERWLADASARSCLTAEDVVPMFGVFAPACPQQPRNGGIRGLPPGFDLGSALLQTLDQRERQLDAPLVMTSELDEQGLNIAALAQPGDPLVVAIDDVTICSPFYPHKPHLGRCGAHFVGLNAQHIAWSYYGRPADEWMAEHWRRHRWQLRRLVDGPMPASEWTPLPTWGSDTQPCQRNRMA